jgi:hypothetical protein
MAGATGDLAAGVQWKFRRKREAGFDADGVARVDSILMAALAQDRFFGDKLVGVGLVYLLGQVAAVAGHFTRVPFRCPDTPERTLEQQIQKQKALSECCFYTLKGRTIGDGFGTGRNPGSPRMHGVSLSCPGLAQPGSRAGNAE